MKKILPILIIALAFTFCNGNKEQARNTEETAAQNTASQKEMLIYGSNECEHCIAFKKKMDSLDIKYTFYDVQVDQSKADEMLRKLEEVKFMGYIAFPVVDVEGDVMVSPELKKVLAVLNK